MVDLINLALPRHCTHYYLRYNLAFTFLKSAINFNRTKRMCAHSLYLKKRRRDKYFVWFFFVFWLQYIFCVSDIENLSLNSSSILWDINKSLLNLFFCLTYAVTFHSETKNKTNKYNSHIKKLCRGVTCLNRNKKAKIKTEHKKKNHL